MKDNVRNIMNVAFRNDPEGSTQSLETKFRVGRSVGRTIYFGEELVGLMDTPDLARRFVEAINKVENRED